MAEGVNLGSVYANFELRTQGLGTGVAAVRNQMSGLQATMQQAGQHTQDLGHRMQGVGQSMQGVGKGMTAGLTLPLVGIGYQAIKTSADFQSSMNTMAAVAGVPAGEIEQLRLLAIQLGADTVFSANEAAAGMLELAKAGISTADIMGGALKNSLDLATAGDLQLADAARITANAMAVFGLSGKESQQAVDALAGAANASSADVSDLALALSMGGSAAAAAGMSIQETTAALALLADQGIRGSDAGTSLKTMFLRLVPSTKEAADEIARLGLQFTDAAGNIRPLEEIAGELQGKMGGLTQAQKIQALQTIFGTDAFRAANAMMNQGAAGIAKYAAETSKSGNASAVAAAKMSGLPGAIEKFKGQMETFLLVVGDRLAPIITKAGEVLGNLAEAFTKLSPGVQTAIVVVAVLLAALGPMLWIMGAFILTIGRAIIMLNLLRNSAMVAGVLNAMRGALMGVRIALTMAAQGAATFVIALARVVASAAVTAATTAAQFAAMGARAVASFTLMAASATMAAVRVVASLVLMAVSAMANALVMAAAWVVAFWPILLAVAIVAVAIALIIKYWDQIKAATIAVFTAIWAFLVGVWDWIKNAVVNAVTFIMAIISAYVSMYLAVWSAVWNAIKAVAQAVWNGIKAVIQAGVAVVRAVIQAGVATVLAVWNGLRGMVSTVAGAIGGVVGAVRGGIDSALGVVRGAVGGFLAAGRGLIDALVNGIKGAAGAIVGAIKAAAGAAAKFLPFSDAKRGPFSHLTASGMAIPSTIAAGILANRGVLDRALSLLPGIPNLNDQGRRSRTTLTIGGTDLSKVAGAAGGTVEHNSEVNIYAKQLTEADIDMAANRAQWKQGMALKGV